MPEGPERTAAVYGDYYSVASGDAIRMLEREAVGTDWGGNGYTTVDHVDELIRVLELGPGKKLADLGAGAGWPGVYIAARSGSDVVISDLAVSGMIAGRERAKERGVETTAEVAASATDVPFADASFDGVTHSDLLC